MSADPTERQAYCNGQWVPESGLAVSVEDVGFALGVTVTERLRTFGGVVWRQAEHVERLRRSAAVVGLDVEVADELDAAISAYGERHAALREPGGDWAIVAFATPGAPGAGPTRCVHGFPLPFASWAAQYDAGVRLWTSSHRQTPGNCWPPALKCRSRMHYYLADREARLRDPGARALLLDQDGYVGEASTANVVMHSAAEGVVSPRIEKVLPGVSVAVLRELAEAAGTPFVERDITLEEFAAADEVWIASTSICLLPVVAIDGRPIGGGRPGPVYRRMLSAWNNAVGLDVRQQALDRAAAATTTAG